MANVVNTIDGKGLKIDAYRRRERARNDAG